MVKKLSYSISYLLQGSIDSNNLLEDNHLPHLLLKWNYFWRSVSFPFKLVNCDHKVQKIQFQYSCFSISSVNFWAVSLSLLLYVIVNSLIPKVSCNFSYYDIRSYFCLDFIATSCINWCHNKHDMNIHFTTSGSNTESVLVYNTYLVYYHNTYLVYYYLVRLLFKHSQTIISVHFCFYTNIIHLSLLFNASDNFLCLHINKHKIVYPI